MPGTKRTIVYLEGKFETGDIPTQEDFYDVFASFLHYSQVQQTPGTSPDDVMSQKAITDAIAAVTGQDISAWKEPVRVATVVNGNLATAFVVGQVVNGVTLALNNRILLKAQTNQSENGIRVVAASGAPPRSTDCDSAAELEGAAVTVQEGAVEPNTNWNQITDGIVLGTSPIVWTRLITPIPDANDTTKGVVEEATPAQLLAAASVGETGAKLFFTPATLQGYRSLVEIAAAVSGGVLNLNFGTQTEAVFNVATTIAANCTVTITSTNGKSFLAQFAITGTVALTMPSSFVFESGEIALGRWVAATKILTLIGTTATEFEIVGFKRGSVWKCISSKFS